MKRREKDIFPCKWSPPCLISLNMQYGKDHFWHLQRIWNAHIHYFSLIYYLLISWHIDDEQCAILFIYITEQTIINSIKKIHFFLHILMNWILLLLYTDVSYTKSSWANKLSYRLKWNIYKRMRLNIKDNLSYNMFVSWNRCAWFWLPYLKSGSCTPPLDELRDEVFLYLQHCNQHPRNTLLAAVSSPNPG